MLFYHDGPVPPVPPLPPAFALPAVSASTSASAYLSQQHALNDLHLPQRPSTPASSSSRGPFAVVDADPFSVAPHPSSASAPAPAPVLVPGSRLAVPGLPFGAMAVVADTRPAWRRTASIRDRREAQIPAGIPDITTASRDLDGFVPYRPPYATRSTTSLSPGHSGAQGIGLAPVPPPQPQVQVPEKRKGIFTSWRFGGFGSRKAGKKAALTSVSSPALIVHHPADSTVSFGTTYQGQNGAPTQPERERLHSSAGATSHDHRRQRQAPHITPEPKTSVFTGKVFFSNQSRNQAADNDAPDLRVPFPRAPSQHNLEIEHLSSETTRPYPRVGDNHPGASSWTNLPQHRSDFTLHSEGSKSRLAVSTMCDALTFPRPRMHAHDITPPESPTRPETDLGMEDDTPPTFQAAVAQSQAREAERQEWAELTARRGRSNSLHRSFELNAQGATRSMSVDRGRHGRHSRSHSQSSSVRSFLSRPSRPSMTMDSTQGDGHKQPSMDSHVPPTRSQSFRIPRKALGALISLGRRHEMPTGVRGGGHLHKSSSSPHLSLDEYGPQRRQSLRTAGNKSNPDPVGRQASRRRRPSGPPRTLQFRLQPHETRGGVQAGVVVVGPSSSSRNDRVPRPIDFAQLHAIRPPSPSLPPLLPTPKRASPITFNSDEIGIAITTPGDEAAPPPPRQRDYFEVADPVPLGHEPSSAHARYLLARQHRRSVTMRAFQGTGRAPAPGHSTSSSASTSSSTSRSLGTAPTTPTLGKSPSRRRPSPPPPLPSLPFSLVDTRDPMSRGPLSPRSPVSPEGRARGTSTLGPRAGGKGSRVRPRSTASSSSYDSSTQVFAPMTGEAKRLRIDKDKDLPPIPPPPSVLPPLAPALAVPTAQQRSQLFSSTSTSASASMSASPPRSPGGALYRPPMLKHMSTASFNTVTVSGLAETAAAATALSRFQEGAQSQSASPAVPSPPRFSTPPRGPRTPARREQSVMDASPTPVRQSAVTVLAPPPPPASPTPRSPARPHGRSVPLASSSPSPSPAPGLHRSVPSVSAVIPSPELFYGPNELFAAAQAAVGDPVILVGPRGPSTDDLFAPRRRSVSDMSFATVRSDASHALADTSGVLGTLAETEESPGRIPPLPRDGESMQSLSTEPDDGGPIQAGPRVLSSESHSHASHTSNASASHPSHASHASQSSYSSYTSYTSENAQRWRSSGVSLRNVSASGHSNDSNSEIHEGYKEDDSVSVHSSDSEATLPDLLPVSSSSALSHYTDAFEGSDTGADADAATSTAEDGDVWATPMQTPMESTPPNIFAPSPASPAVPDPQVTPQPPRASALPPSTPEGPANAIPGAYGPGPAPTLTVSEGDHEEMLTMTPRGGRDRSATSSDSGTIEPETCAPRRSFSPASVSSGSDVSVRQSFEDNFRGLFYRAPDMPSPEHRSRKLPAPRSLLAAAQRSQRTSRAGAGSGSGTGSPRSSARASPEPQNIVGLGISLNDERDRDDRLPLTSAPRTVPRATERPIGSGASSPLAKASSRPSSRTATRSTDRSPRQSSTSLGIMGMTPVSAGASLARGAGVLDSDNIPMSSTPPRTPPPTIDTPADDSWITKSYHRLSQVMVARGATPNLSMSLRKPRPLSVDEQREHQQQQVMPFSPGTFGVDIDPFAAITVHSPVPSAPHTPRRTGSGSSSAAVLPLTPKTEVLERSPNPSAR